MISEYKKKYFTNKIFLFLYKFVFICLSKESLLISWFNLLHKMGQDFLDIQYNWL